MSSDTLTITCNQLFSRRGLGYLWEKRTDLDKGQESILQSLWTNKKKGLIQCEQTINYRLSNKKAGKLGFGRLYGSKGSLETLERECRGTLCREYYHDIDIVNCHPVLLPQLAKKLFDMDMPHVEEYCENRDETLKKISDNREDAKNAVIKILYGGRNAYPFLDLFQKEVKELTKRLLKLEKYNALWDCCQAEDNKYGTFLAFVLQTEEREIMLKLRDWFETNKWSVDVLSYDGIMIRKNPSLSLTVDTFASVEQYIFETTGYMVKVLDKEFSYYEVPQADDTERIGDLSRAQYQEEKVRFEQNHFYYIPTNQYAEVRDGTVTFYDLEHAREYFKKSFNIKKSERLTDYTSLFDIWRSDLTMRCIRKIDFKPTHDLETFVLPLNYAYIWSELGPGAQKSIDAFKYLIDVNTNHNQDEAAYVLKYIAHLLQKPFEPPRTALLFIGEEGAGKDMIWEFLGTKVLGSLYYQDYTRNEQFFAPHDCGRQDKLLVKVQEADSTFCRKHSSDLKAFITSPTVSFNPKGKKEYARDNYMRLVMTTNKGNPLELSQSDRRWLIFTNTNELCKDYEKIKDIVANLFTDPGAGAAIAEYLLHYPLDTFHPETHKPENIFKRLILETELTSEEQFLQQWDGQEVSGGMLFNLYRSYCQDNDLPHAQNAKSFGIRLLKPLASNTLKKRRGGDAVYYYK